MTACNVFTQQEPDAAHSKLEQLPDVTLQRITRAAALKNLKETILMLAKEKGYTAAGIKSALDANEFKFSDKTIAAVINEEKTVFAKQERHNPGISIAIARRSDEKRRRIKIPACRQYVLTSRVQGTLSVRLHLGQNESAKRAFSQPVS